MPESMRAIVLEKFDTNLVNALRNLKVKEKPVPVPKDREVLIKIEAAPINPSDIAFIRGDYNIVKPTPVTAGFEGCGLVVDTGNSKEAKALMGKRVSCFTQEQDDGTWAEYFVTRPYNCLVLKDEMDMDQAACLFINPFTAWALFNLVKHAKAKAFIQNAAAGQIGSFLRTFASDENIACINIVRKESHVERLKEQGEKWVLNSAEEGFEEKLGQLANELKAPVAFDAVGGDMTGHIMNALPPHSTCYVYGGLSGLPVSGIQVLPLIFKNKILTGFNLNDWEDFSNRENFNKVADTIQSLIISGKISTSIQRSAKFEDISRALVLYISRMSNGKILLKP